MRQCCVQVEVDVVGVGGGGRLLMTARVRVVVPVQGQADGLCRQMRLVQVQGRRLVHQEARVVAAAGHVHRVTHVGALVVVLRGADRDLVRLVLLRVLALSAHRIDRIVKPDVSLLLLNGRLL